MIESSGLITILDAAVADGAGTSIYVGDYDRIFLQLGSADDTGAANATINFVGSLSNTAPTFSAARSVSNHFEYIDVIDLEDGASIDGDTGIAFAAANDFRNLEVNFGGLKWINAVVSSWVDGQITLKVYGVTH